MAMRPFCGGKSRLPRDENRPDAQPGRLMLRSFFNRGLVGGRQRGLSEAAERTAIIAETLCREQQLGVNEIAKRLDISKVTLYKIPAPPGHHHA